MQNNNHKTSLKISANLIIGAIIFGLVAFFNKTSPFICGFGLVVYSILGYLYSVLFISEKNWLDLRAVFHAVWIGTIGLATFRLVEYQEPWETKTWILLFLVYFIFQIGITLGMNLCNKKYDKLMSKVAKFHIKNIYFSYKENRLFSICVITTLIGLLCFIASVIIKGYIPCFSDSTTAYIDFYTKFHIFSVASTAASGLCFYCIKTQELSKAKKIILWLCMLYLVILFPIMVVSRGLFMTAALSLTTAIFYTCGKKLWVLCLSIVIIASVYMSASLLRNYSDAQLETFFEPSKIEIETNPNLDKDDEDSYLDHIKTFQLSPKAAFLYSYLTVSHDNFDVAIKKVEDYTWGARQLAPFNTVLRIDAINEINENNENFLIRPHLNTINLIGDAYYDFHEIGVIIFAVVWSLIFGFIQSFYEKSKGCFSVLVLGNTLTPIALCFFSSWMSIFSHWLLWGTVLLFFIAASITIKSPKKAA